jgi:hypothetical protein
MLVRKDANRANQMIVTLSNTRRSGLRYFLYAFRNRVVSVRAVQMPAEQARRADRRRVVKCHASQGRAHSSDTGSHAGVKKPIRPCLLHILECMNNFSSLCLCLWRFDGLLICLVTTTHRGANAGLATLAAQSRKH